ncbi:MAG: hypothetical protein ACKOC9_03515 [Alphaproteobacteria bacterium]
MSIPPLEGLRVLDLARVVAPEALAACITEITTTILKAPPAAMALTKRCVDEGLERDPRSALATECWPLRRAWPSRNGARKCRISADPYRPSHKLGIARP